MPRCAGPTAFATVAAPGFAAPPESYRPIGSSGASSRRSSTTPSTLGLHAADVMVSAYVDADVAATPSSNTGGTAANDCCTAVTSWETFAVVHSPLAAAGAGRNAITSTGAPARAWPSAATTAFGACDPSIAAPRATVGETVCTEERIASNAAA